MYATAILVSLMVVLRAATLEGVANDFLVSKWKLWYHSLDVNHDGTISFLDVEKSRVKFSKLHMYGEEKSKPIKESFTSWWNKFVLRGRTGEISEQEFVEALSNDHKADKNRFKEEMTKCFNFVFDLIDTNKDRSISEEEFLIVFKAYGHENVDLDTKFFQAYNPQENRVSFIQIVDSWIDFVTGDDASAGSIVKTAFESGV